MAAVALQRELDAYADAIDKYTRQARSYSSAATKHNENIDTYKQYVEQKTAGNYNAYSPEVFFATTKGDRLIRSDMMKEVKASELGNYYTRHLKANQYVLIPKQEGDMPAPGKFTMEQPTQPGAAPTGTVAQMRRLDEPSLIDVERNADRGLISNAFNF